MLYFQLIMLFVHPLIFLPPQTRQPTCIYSIYSTKVVYYLLIGQVRTLRTYFCTFSNANIFASRSFLGNLECTIVFSTLELYCIHLLSTIIVYNLSSYRSSKFTIAKTQKRHPYLFVKSYDEHNSITTMNQ